jgi:branched-chain amino acid transport system permease protein
MSSDAAAGEGALAGRRRARRLEGGRAARWGLATAVLVVILAVQGDQILDLLGPDRAVLVQAVLTGLLSGGVYGLVALGLTLIFGVLDIINFAHGALLTVGMYCSWALVDSFGLSPYATLAITVPVMFLVGAAIQAGLIDRVLGQPLENQLLLTFGVAIVAENLLLVGFGADPRSVSGGPGGSLEILGATASWARIVAFFGALAIAGAVWALLQRSRTGTAIRAVASNPGGARLVGVDVRRIYVITFGIGTACVGAAAALILPFTPLEPTAGATFTILAFVVVVLGGLGSVPGAILGGLLIGVAQEVGGVVFPAQSKLLAVFIVFLAVLFLRPQGLLKGRA